jgi:hypothetical protein
MYNNIIDLLQKINQRSCGRVTGFAIGNNDPGSFEDYDHYTTPIRETASLIYAGVVVGNLDIAREISQLVDGKIDYIFVDAEKKISLSSEGQTIVSDAERIIKENISKSLIMTYKGNDLAAQTFDDLIGTLVADLPKVKLAIIGVGNVGFKIALKTMERGVNISLYRRNQKMLNRITELLNQTKPGCLIAEAEVAANIKDACVGASIIVACANKKGIITADDLTKVDCFSPLILIDVGKGCFADDVVDSEYCIYRLDISATQKHYFSSLVEINQAYSRSLGRKYLDHENIVLLSQGLLGKYGEFVVDNINNPKRLLGIANGQGSFIRDYALFHRQIKYLSDVLKISFDF